MTKILIDRSVLEQVLEALEPYADIKPRDWKTDREKLWRSYDALREALAEQPAEQAPIAPATVIAAMQADPAYAWSWHCNIVMAFIDAGGDYYTANQGAARFMKLLANVEPAYDLPAAPQPAKPAEQQCWKCGDLDPAGHAKCNVPACGMKEDTQPAKREPLTDAEILHALMLSPPEPSLWPHLKDEATVGDVQRAVIAIARAIERAHGIGEQQ